MTILSFFVKLVKNNIVAVSIGLPNLAINLGTQTILDVFFHWSGFYALLAYLVGTALSIQYSVLFNMITKANFRVGKHEYNYSHKKSG